ncbi:DUF2771 family protein [Williamsia sp. CHRR-6]|uniref:DUF2771 family protein n=1 Tax=Williamsia sp. CHRR-6 TaxID=2835871 RepID=UPI001BDAC234|nr:DUF2771 family protein [Williamsia sp. CHRR-6]MBT0566404.1 DUF2771 family protein [Williamsia sp. CHRR-6]
MPTLTSGEKKFLAIATVVGVLFVAVVGGTVAYLSAGEKKDKYPYIQATSGKATVAVPPTKFCDVTDITICPIEDRQPTRFPVQVDSNLLLSLSRGLFDAPWSYVVEYLTPNGFVTEVSRLQKSGTRYALTLQSRPDKILSTVEIQLPSAAVDPSGQQLARAYWGLDTLPKPVADQLK